MKTIIFYGKSQVGLVVLLSLLAHNYKVKIMPEDDIIREAGKYYNLETVTLDTMGDYDYFISCHGEKIIPARYLKGICINMHDCLDKYKGRTPIQRYIDNKDTKASIMSHYMIAEPDMGEIIHEEYFDTPVITTFGQYYNLAVPYYLRCIEETLKKVTRTVAFTRIRDDECKLELWLSYYSKYFDDLMVVVYGAHDFTSITNRYNCKVIVISDNNEESGGIHSVKSLEFIKEKQKELLKTHEWVFYSDADEFVIPKVGTLKDFMETTRERQTFCEGYEIFRSEGEELIDYTKPILFQRQNWVQDENGSYNKPLLSRIPSEWSHGFHKLESMTDEDAKSINNTGLYLLHFKHINEKNVIYEKFKQSEIPKNIRQAL